LYFSGFESATGYRIWQTDGTTAGTVVFYASGTNALVNFNGQLKHPGNINAGSVSAQSMTVVGNMIYLSALTPLTTGTEPYSSNGVAAPVLLGDIFPGSPGSNPFLFNYFNGKTYFTAFDGTRGRELWRTDGSAAGTSLFMDILPAPYEPTGISAAGSRPSGFANVNGALLFFADDGYSGDRHGTELWVTDGTLGGTRMVKDINPGIDDGTISAGPVVNGRYYFLADDGVHGTELWSTDGTEAATQMVADLTPGADSSSIQNLISYNGTVAFTYNDGTSGVRWYSVDAPASTISVPTGKPDLVASSDLGSSSTDNVTSRDNSSTSKNLQFTVDGSIAGAAVTLYADGVAIGSAVATGSTTTIITDGTLDLADGVHSIQVRQVIPGMDESFNSEELLVTIDTSAPTVDIVDVSPDPRTNSVSSMTINFSRAVTGVDRPDFSLSRDGGPNLLTSSQTVTTSQFTNTNIRWTLNNLSSITAVAGSYTLTLTAAGSNVTDLTAGNALTTDASDSWVLSMPAWVGAGSQASWNSSTKVLTVSGATTIVGDPVADAATLNADGAAATVTFNPVGTNRAKLVAFNLTNGATASVVSIGVDRTALNHRVLVTTSINVDANSTLDLADNDLIVDYSAGNPASTVEAMVAAGFGINGDWLGKRITSSVAAAPSSNGNYAIGVANNALLVNPFGNGTTSPLFDGQTVDSSAVLVKFTHRVDLDLDGVVTGNDAAVFNGAYSEGDAGATWMSGDVDFDGLYGSNDAAIFNSFYDESLGAI
jgi:ELWxxDGT repeat protein